MVNRRQLTLTAASLLALPSIALAQQYPVRPIKLIYNFAPGGPGDAIARYVAQQMGEILGQQIIVDNRTGGGGVIGILAAANAQPDGYTFLYTTATGVVQVPLVNKDAGFDPAKSLVPIGGVGVTPLAILAHPSVPANDVPSFLAWAKQQPSGVFMAGAGPIIEVFMARLANEAKVKLVFVPYRGAAPALQAVLAGDVKLYFNVPSAATTEFIKAGKLKVIGVTSPEPSPLFPGGEPISKHLPGYIQEITFAMWAPPGIPADAANKLGEALRKVLSDPGIADRFAANGLAVRAMAAEEVSRVVRKDTESIRQILATTPIKFG